MKNLFKVFGIIALVAVVGFSSAGCSGGAGPDLDDDDDDNIVTFSLIKVNETSFKIAIDGASWKPSMSAGVLAELGPFEVFIDGKGQGVIQVSEHKKANVYFEQDSVNGSRDPRLLTLKPDYTRVNGTITLNLSNLPNLDPVDLIGTRPNIDELIYRVDPAKSSITFTNIP
jgi:hypothetical protein